MIRIELMDAHLKNINTLVVDADDTLREMLCEVLQKLGFTKGFSAANSVEALTIIEKESIDLIFTDWDLNRFLGTKIDDIVCLTGSEFVIKIRHSDVLSQARTPIIMLLGSTLNNAVAYARDSGVNETVTKPITAEELCEAITNIIEKPRPFIKEEGYRGPCRRLKQAPWKGKTERRKQHVRVIAAANHRK